ncbi:MAG TPA: AbrB/MazE/SpoVT family DNA-binding domain-containing protein [Thermoanaerobaculia bacterium]
MAASTLTSKGQITIPKEVRDRLGVQEGDRIVFQFDEQDRLILRPETRDPLGNLVGLLRHRAKDRPVTVEEMNEAVRAKAAEKFGGFSILQ